MIFQGFDSNALSPQQVIAIAEKEGLSPLRVSLQSNGYRQSASFWEAPKDIDADLDRYPVISLGSDVDVVGKLSRNIADSVQFPASSAYMHFLGCVSSAMLGRFTVDYHGTDQPTSLYIVISQPPSTGKSAVNSLAIAPIVAEVELINERRKRERKQVMAKLGALAKEMKGEKSGADMQTLYEEKDLLEEKLLSLCDVVYPVSDTTPEGLARINNRQGNFAVISDEATSINSLLGMTYGDGGRKTNSELVLKAWDAGHVSIARANADNNMSFVAMGAISVIAQDETINGIMEAGARGIGVSERFLLVREESFLGKRQFIDDDGSSTYTSVDGELKAGYYQLIHNIMSEQDVKLRVSPMAIRYLNKARQELEPHLADGGKYSHTMLRGALGKFDKQALRLAAVVHTVRNWYSKNSNPQKSREIDLDTMMEAVAMFHELSKTYLSSAEAAGHAGDKAEMRAIIDVLTKRARNTKGVMKFRSIYDAVRMNKPFVGQAGVTARIRDALLPQLEELGYICVIGDDVFVNPRLVV